MKKYTGLWACLVGAMCLLVFGKAWADGKNDSKSGHFHNLNQRFLGPDLNIEKYIKKFEGEDRDVYRARAAIMQALAIEPKTKVADIGAGTGLFTRLFCQQVGSQGWVYAVDISPGFIDHIA
ncbi:MAG: hypothetical protein K8F91_06530, partial [Candidatus Obscuribacterales bacterium]|nr:hypothetical protein [Candidatus Obscuribacterales bacterium]